MELKEDLRNEIRAWMFRLRLDNSHIQKDAPAKCIVSTIAAIILVVWGVYGYSHGLDVQITSILLPIAIAVAIVNGMLWNPTSAKWLVENCEVES